MNSNTTSREIPPPSSLPSSQTIDYKKHPIPLTKNCTILHEKVVKTATTKRKLKKQPNKQEVLAEHFKQLVAACINKVDNNKENEKTTLPGAANIRSKWETVNLANSCAECSYGYDSPMDMKLRQDKRHQWVGCDYSSCTYWAHAFCADFNITANKKKLLSFYCPKHTF